MAGGGGGVGGGGGGRTVGVPRSPFSPLNPRLPKGI
jgi:hypothetical protein